MKNQSQNQIPMNPDSMNPNLVVEVARAIGSCDFRTTVSRYVLGNNPWVITVGELTWQRHLVVEQINEDGTDATLKILTPVQSDKFGYDINTEDAERTVNLRELIADRYAGVVLTLKHKSVAA